MDERFSRTALLVGEPAIEKLNKSHVAVFGIGGVGGHVVEALVRSGIGHITIVDNDVVALSNINRQIIATTDTIGRLKVDVMKERILSINPSCDVKTIKMFVTDDNINEIDFSNFDYVVDAIDSVKGKIAIIVKAKELDKPVISSMGAGNKMNPMGFIVSDINKTEVDPLAKAVRVKLRKLGINNVKVVYSRELPIDTNSDVPGSNAFVPSAAGLLIASEVIKHLIK